MPRCPHCASLRSLMTGHCGHMEWHTCRTCGEDYEYNNLNRNPSAPEPVTVGTTDHMRAWGHQGEEI